MAKLSLLKFDATARCTYMYSQKHNLCRKYWKLKHWNKN